MRKENHDNHYHESCHCSDCCGDRTHNPRREGYGFRRGSRVLGWLVVVQLLLGAFAQTLPALEEAGALGFSEALTLALESPAVALAETNLDLARRQLEVVASPLSAQLSGGYTRTRGALESPTFPEAESLNTSGLDPLSAHRDLERGALRAALRQRAAGALGRAAG